MPKNSFLKQLQESFQILSRGGNKIDSKVQYDDEVPFIGSELESQEVLDLIRKVKNLSQTRKSIYDDYKYMLQDAIISGCLELISDEASIIDDVTGMSYWVDCPTNKTLEKELNEWLKNTIEINKLVWRMTWQLLVDGGFFLRTFKNDEEAQKYVDLGNYFELVKDYLSVTDITMYGKTIAYQWQDEKDENDISLCKEDEFIHIFWDKGAYETITVEYSEKDNEGIFTRKTKDCKAVYGTSYLENSRQAFLILDLIDTMLLSARVNKTTLTRLIMTEVGTAGKTETKRIIDRVKGAFKVSSLKINNSYKEGDKTATIQNVYIPTRNGKGEVRVDEFGGNSDIRDISDIEYYTDKLMASLRVPKAFLGLDSNITAGLGANTMTKVDIRYARLIKTVKTLIKEAVTEMVKFKISTSSDLLKKADKNDWTIESVPVSTAEEDEKATTLQTVVSTADQIKTLLGDCSKIDMDSLIKYLIDYIIDLPDAELFYDVKSGDSEDSTENSSNKVNTDEILNKIGQAIQNSTNNNQEEEETDEK